MKDQPLGSVAVRGIDIEASEPIPEKYRTTERPPVELIPTERIGGTEEEPHLEPWRPPWLAMRGRPDIATLPQAPRLTHRELPLNSLTVWGAEDRKPYFDATYPWGCLCRVLSIGQGSGVLIGPQHVLTASHCIDWSADGAGTVEVLRFTAGVVGRTSAIKKVRYYSKVGTPGFSEIDEDYVVITTVDRLGDRYGYMGCRTYNNSWDDEPYWYNIGYPGSFYGGTVPTWQQGSSLDEDEWDSGAARAMTSTADLTIGNSGGPIFGFWDDGPYVVAVASAEGNVVLSGDENWCSGGSALTRLVNRARAFDS